MVPGAGDKTGSRQLCSLSRPGRVGETLKTNQDAFRNCLCFLERKDMMSFAVFDGHGAEGHLVSQYLQENLHGRPDSSRES
jgi:serine/threonine protein phosphatase PrpC